MAPVAVNVSFEQLEPASPHPVVLNDQSSPPGELQMYVLPSVPHVV
jgi:hypothetical protein